MQAGMQAGGMAFGQKTGIGMGQVGTQAFGQRPLGTGFAGTQPGFGAQDQSGTSAKYGPVPSAETGFKHVNVNMMKQYETRSIEELRFEDYLRGAAKPAGGVFQAGATRLGGSPIGAAGFKPAGTATSPFGAKPFGTGVAGQQTQTSPFGVKTGLGAMGQQPFGAKPMGQGLPFGQQGGLMGQVGPGMMQGGMMQAGMQGGMMQGGLQGGMMQGGMMPGMMQGGLMQQGGMMQSGLMQQGGLQGMGLQKGLQAGMQSGMMPGMMQQGMMQPGMMQQGMMYPGMMQGPQGPMMGYMPMTPTRPPQPIPAPLPQGVTSAAPYGDRKLFRGVSDEKAPETPVKEAPSSAARFAPGSANRRRIVPKLTPGPTFEETDQADVVASRLREPLIPAKISTKLMIQHPRRTGQSKDFIDQSDSSVLEPSPREDRERFSLSIQSHTPSASVLQSTPAVPRPMVGSGQEETPKLQEQAAYRSPTFTDPRQSAAQGKRLIRPKAMHPNEVYETSSDTLSVSASQERDLKPKPSPRIRISPGYYIVANGAPMTEDELSKLPLGQLRQVHDLILGHPQFGEVHFLSPTDLSSYPNLIEIVRISNGSVEVYPDDYEHKPPIGSELNKPARITLKLIYPKDKVSKLPITDPSKLGDFELKLRACNEKLGAKFISYDLYVGTWVFEVAHFSRYGLDSDDENDTPAAPAAAAAAAVVPPKAQVPVVAPLKMPLVQPLAAPAAKALVPARTTEGSDKENVSHSDSEDAAATGADEDDDDEDDEDDEDSEDDEDDEGSENSLASDSASKRQPSEFKPRDAHKPPTFDDGDNWLLARPSKVSTSTQQLVNQLDMDRVPFLSMRASLFDDVPPAPSDVALDDDVRGRPLQTAPQAELSSSSRPDLSTLETVSYLPARSTRAPNIFAQSQVATTTPTRRVAPKTSSTPALPSPVRPNFSAAPAVGLPRKGAVAPASFLTMTSPRPAAHPVSAAAAAGKPSSQGYDHLPAPFQVDDLSLKFEKGQSDYGFVLGRSFRVGWGPNGQLVVPSSSPTSSVLKIHQVHAGEKASHPHAQAGNANFIRRLKSCMEVQRTAKRIGFHSQSNDMEDAFESDQEDQRPYRRCHSVSEGHDIISALRPLFEADASDSIDAQVALTALNLVDALWCCPSPFSQPYASEQFRKSRLTEWLRRIPTRLYTGPTGVLSDPQNATDDESALTAIFDSLSVCDLAGAVKTALSKKDYHLGMMISQLFGNEGTKTLVHQQLEYWIKSAATNFINLNRIRIFALCAGRLVLPDLALAVIDGLDWKRAFGLCLWYKCAMSDSIADAVGAFDTICATAYDDFHVNKPHPRPAYQRDAAVFAAGSINSSLRSLWQGADDVCYRLLKLYSSSVQNPYRFESVLVPETHSANLLDLQLSWHLLTILQSSASHSLPAHRHVQLCVEFAWQLELLGLWDSSIFVLEHIPDASVRRFAIADVLDRNSHKANSAFLKQLAADSLDVSYERIELALATHAKYQGRYASQAEHLINACRAVPSDGGFESAYYVVIRDVLPDILKKNNLGDLQYLGGLVAKLELPTNSKYDVVVRYVKARTLLQELRACDLDADRAVIVRELVQLDVLSLCHELALWQPANIEKERDMNNASDLILPSNDHASFNEELCLVSMTRELVRSLLAIVSAYDAVTGLTDEDQLLLDHACDALTDCSASLPLLENDRLLVISFLTSKLQEVV
eukprot:m.347387 g.347387  ORF g.347387 m.347387 type:complete len:1706 (+) comp55855_c1_seq1:1-5118(+)